MNLIIFGPQGSGKGTQASKLAQKYNLKHVETGQIFREISKEDSPRGKMIAQFLNEKNEMIPDNIAVDTLKHYLEKVSPDAGLIIDSAPRTVGQIELVEKMLKQLGRQLDKAIYITLPYEQSVARVSKRYKCPACNKKFVLGKDIQSKEDPCPICGGPVIQRKDDTPEGIAKRLKDFHKITMPVIEHYREKGMLLEADGNQDVEKVFEDIKQALGD